MKKQLKHRKDENLSQWMDRLTEYYNTHVLTKKVLRDLLQEVSVQSYIEGSVAMESILTSRVKQ